MPGLEQIDHMEFEALFFRAHICMNQITQK